MNERWHGTAGGYSNHGCRCAACREANTLYRRGGRLDKKHDLDWQDNAACKGAPVNLFFIELGENYLPLARELCGRCPVRAECLTFAVEANIGYGLWGGLTERERRLLRRERVS